VSVLEPGSFRDNGRLEDDVLLTAMLRVEQAWMAALVVGGAGGAEAAEALAAVPAMPTLDPVAVEATGNPVPAFVAWLRTQVDDLESAALVHRGLTSQDVLDTAMMLVAKDVLTQIGADLTSVALALGRLADRHRSTVMAGRTLTQYAVPVTFGLVAAQWLAGVLDARDRVRSLRDTLPVQCGGAAGTLSLAGDLVADPVAAARGLATTLGLSWPGLPWHTRRTPVTRLGDALAETCDVLGVLAADLLQLGRPEVGEVSERQPPGRGGSSTMPGKQNPVLSILVRSAALQAPWLAAQLHHASAMAVDQRPDGAWHAEWPAVRRLLQLTSVAAAQAAELVDMIEVHEDVMADRVAAAQESLLAERGSGDGAPTEYLGAATVFVDEVLARLAAAEGGGG
jgi:3-carboxy-cis,cis-muconate cycloisomerase